MAESSRRYIIDFRDCPSQRQKMPEREVKERKDGFEEVETGFRIEEAQREARRCLSCRRCLGCGLCLAVCEPKAIVFEQEDEISDLKVDHIIISPEVGTYMPLSRGELGYGECKNVVSSFEFERILADDGPSCGLIMRPFDGEIPERIAFILDTSLNGEETKEDGNILLSYTLQEADLTLKKVEGLEVSVFVSESTPVEKVSNQAAKKGIKITRGEVLEVKETEDTKNLIVTFMEDEEKGEEEFEMLVICKQPEISPEIKGLIGSLS